MTLEEVLQKHFGLKGNLFKKNYSENGNWTKQGHESYSKLTECLYDLAKVTDKVNANKIIDELDEIEWIKE